MILNFFLNKEYISFTGTWTLFQYKDFLGMGIPITYIVRWSWDLLNGLVQNSSISIANALEILQFCTKPSILSL